MSVINPFKTSRIFSVNTGWQFNVAATYRPVLWQVIANHPQNDDFTPANPDKAAYVYSLDISSDADGDETSITAKVLIDGVDQTPTLTFTGIDSNLNQTAKFSSPIKCNPGSKIGLDIKRDDGTADSTELTVLLHYFTLI